MKLQHVAVGKLNGWLLELNFAGQIINFCSQLSCKKPFLNLFIYLFTHLHLFIYLLIYLFIHSLIYLSLSEFFKFC